MKKYHQMAELSMNRQYNTNSYNIIVVCVCVCVCVCECECERIFSTSILIIHIKNNIT